MFDPQPNQPYPYQPAYQPPVKPHRGLAIASLVLGIIGAVFGLIPLTFFIALPCGVLALIFGLLGRKHGTGKAGAILGAIAIVLGIVGIVIVGRAVDDVNNDLSAALPQVVPTSASSSASGGVDEAFVSTVHADGLLAGASDDQIIDIGHQTCAAFDAGNDFLTVTQTVMDAGGMDAYDAGYFIGAALFSYCPSDLASIPGQ